MYSGQTKTNPQGTLAQYPTDPELRGHKSLQQD